ncbi:hypothetical protein CRM22_001593 [Opisthorchis felineus]|uniref:Death domain-containing protein n=1 Tax=Opisthorchis felineus TaxID=147828 RepID=A0A4S2MA39_OPIFE|nr:hypothetical protein CRM22_001593 [Opisthorchis felineus]
MSIIETEKQTDGEVVEKGSNKENLDTEVSTEGLDSAKDFSENKEQQLEESVQPNVEDKPETLLTTAPDREPVSIQSVTDTVMENLPNLEDLCLDNLDELLQRFRETFEGALSMSESYAKDYTEKALAMESALSALAAYNKKALEQLGKLTLDAVKSKESSNIPADEAELKLGEAFVEKAKLLVETAGKQLEYSKQLGAITRPLTSWRLDASKAVWEAQSALKMAEKQYDDIKQRAQLRRPTQAQIPRMTTEPKQEESYQRPPQEEPVLDTGKSAEPDSTLQTQQPLLDQSQRRERGSRPIDQERQPIKFWPKHVYTDKHGEEICYIRAPSDCLVKKDEIECRFSETGALWPKIAGHSEFIGPLVSIILLEDTENIIWSDEPWIVGVPNKYIKATSKESVIFTIESGPNGVPELEMDPTKVPTKDLVSWVERQTTEVVSDGRHYLECRVRRLSPVTLAPCARIRKDSAEIGPLGGRLISVTEPKVALYIPESAVKVSLPFTLQVKQMDHRQLSFVKAQNELLMKEFLTCSPLVYLTSARKTTFKPVHISFPIPEQTPPQRSNVDPSILNRVRYDNHCERSMLSEDGTGSTGYKSSEATVFNNFQKSLLLAQLISGQRKEVSAVVIMQNSEKTGDNWTVCEDAELVDTVDGVVTFSLQKIESCRFLVLKLSRMIDSETLSHCATLIEEGLSKSLVRIALLQHLKYPHQLCLICGQQDQLDADIKALNEEAYHEVEKPYGPVLLKEGQKMDIFIRPNLRLVGSEKNSSQKKLTMKISLASISPNLNKFVVEAIDQSAQVGFDKHHGVVDIYCEKDVCIPISPERNKQAGVQSGPLTINTPSKTKKPRYRIIQEPVRLVRLVVSLPKAPTTNPTPWNQSDFDFKPKDVVTHSYLKDLAKKLPGDSWQRLGSALDMSRGRLQVVSAKVGEAAEPLALAMLTSWIKTLPISADRFAILYRALQVIGQFDLAAELYSAGCSVNEDQDSVDSSPRKSVR